MSMKSLCRAAPLLLLLAPALSSCGGDDAASSGPQEVVITDAGYEPANLRIQAGSRVTFVNRSRDSPHTAKDDSDGHIEVSPQSGITKHDGSEVNRANPIGFATHSLFPKEFQTVIFPVVRKYSYYCAFHPEMKGTIDVVENDG